MRVFRNHFKKVNSKVGKQGCVLTIGNFDGVHLGHQDLLKELKNKAQELSLPASVMIFEPQPKEFFKSDKVPARLMRCREKLAALKNHAVENVYLINFNAQFANLSAKQFIEDLLVNKLAVHHLIIGNDFQFGHRRQGNVAMLMEAGKKFGFSVQVISPFIFNGERVSSSRIREFLQAGSLQQAARYLGRPYSMIGHVVHGNKLGRALGYPTANINLQRCKSPISGIFVAQVHGLTDYPLPGVASLGIRPTVGGKQHLLEVYLFDFNQDIYGRLIKVEFLNKLRDEECFSSLEQLKIQIAKDVEQAKEFFK